jgi:hypothetical protein
MKAQKPDLNRENTENNATLMSTFAKRSESE